MVLQEHAKMAVLHDAMGIGRAVFVSIVVLSKEMSSITYHKYI